MEGEAGLVVLRIPLTVCMIAGPTQQPAPQPLGTSRLLGCRFETALKGIQEATGARQEPIWDRRFAANPENRVRGLVGALPADERRFQRTQEAFDSLGSHLPVMSHRPALLRRRRGAKEHEAAGRQ